MRQAFHVATSPVVQSAWERGQELYVHGVIYSLKDGLLRCLCGPLGRDSEMKMELAEFEGSGKTFVGAAGMQVRHRRRCYGVSILRRGNGCIYLLPDETAGAGGVRGVGQDVRRRRWHAAAASPCRQRRMIRSGNDLIPFFALLSSFIQPNGTPPGLSAGQRRRLVRQPDRPQADLRSLYLCVSVIYAVHSLRHVSCVLTHALRRRAPAARPAV